MKRGALVLLIAQIVFFLFELLAYYQTYYVLISPLIQKELVDSIAQPHIITAVSVTPTIILCVILYIKKQYLPCMIISSIAILWTQISPYVLTVKVPT